MIFNLLWPLILLGVLLYCIETFIPMNESIKTLIRIIIGLAIVLHLLHAFGVIGSSQTILQ